MRLREALHLVEAERKIVGARDREVLGDRDDDAGRQEQRDDKEHHEREALLRKPAAALDVIDAAESRVHRAPEGGADPDGAGGGRDADRGRAVTDALDSAGHLVLLDGRKDPLEIVDHGLLDIARLDHLAEDEEDQEGEREESESEVVGDHRRHAGDVLAVGPMPEGVEPVARPRPHGRSIDLRAASSARLANLTPAVAACAATATPAHAKSSTPWIPATARAGPRAARARAGSGRSACGGFEAGGFGRGFGFGFGLALAAGEALAGLLFGFAASPRRRHRGAAGSSSQGGSTADCRRLPPGFGRLPARLRRLPSPCIQRGIYPRAAKECPVCALIARALEKSF